MSISTETVAQELKRRTETHHNAAEALLMPRFDSIGRPEEYAAILRMFYGFFAPLEKAVTQHISQQDLADIQQRIKAHKIVLDLACLTASDQVPPVCTKLPAINNPSQALGSLYVLEGSSLGGRYLYKMLLRKHGAWLTEECLTFFNGYGEETGKKWTSLQERLNQAADKEGIIDAANETFILLRQWIKDTLYYNGINH